MCGTKTTNESLSLSFMCFKCLLCVYEEVRVKSRMRKVCSLSSFLFFSFLLLVCVEKYVNFSMWWKNKKKFKKSKQTPKQKRERERD